MKILELSRGFVSLISDEDYELVSQYKWFVTGRKDNWYAARRNGKGQQKLHRFLIEHWGYDTTLFVDHIDRNGLNNQRENIRMVTRSENQHNRRSPRKNAHKGVTKAIYKQIKTDGTPVEYYGWTARIKNKGKLVFNRVFRTEEEAIAAHEQKMLELFGHLDYII